MIQGTVVGSGCDTSADTCDSWVVTATDVTCGQTAVLNTTSPGGGPASVYPAVLETYNLASCDQFPAVGQTTFSGFTLTDPSGNGISLPYGLATLVDADPSLPSCGYGGTWSGSTFTLLYLHPARQAPDGAISPHLGSRFRPERNASGEV